MINRHLQLIDQLTNLIKEKDDTQSYFNQTSLHKFEFRFFLCMSIVRFELQTTGRISDLTADAISQLFAFGTFEYYYRDFPAVYEKCSELFSILLNYNDRLKNHDLPGKIGLEDKKWIEYYKDRIKDLMLSNPPNH